MKPTELRLLSVPLNAKAEILYCSARKQEFVQFIVIPFSQNYYHNEELKWISMDCNTLSKHSLHFEHLESLLKERNMFLPQHWTPTLNTVHYGNHAFVYYSLRKRKLTIPVMRKINNMGEENKQFCQQQSSHNQTQAVVPLYLKCPWSQQNSL